MNRLLPLTVVALLMACASVAHAALDAAWKAIPARTAADSLPLVLRVMETRGAPGVRPGEAAYALGQFRYVRGEYVGAAEAFLRAYAKLSGSDRPAARYAYGLSTLAMGNTGAARAAFEQVSDESPELRPLAKYGIAAAWDADRRPEKAYDVLREMLAGEPGEAGPAALERYAALAAQFHHDAEAREARTRLARHYPRSLEAARLAATAPPRGGLEGARSPSRLPAP